MINEAFGRRLREERERRHISLDSISSNTKIGLALLEGLERGNVARWPSGIFRRAFIRSYAEAVGLDADETAREFLACFPDPAEAPAAAAAAKPVPVAHRPEALRLTLVDTGNPFSRGRLLARLRQRLAAVAWDGGVVTAMAAMVFLVCGKFWLPLGVSTLTYYLGGILLLGNTPGVSLLAASEERGRGNPTGASRGRELREQAAQLIRRFKLKVMPGLGPSVDLNAPNPSIRHFEHVRL